MGIGESIGPVDASGRTQVAGVWVAGNVADLGAGVVAAAAGGIGAATAINADLADEDTRNAVSLYRDQHIRRSAA
jgi:hypothetical protein